MAGKAMAATLENLYRYQSFGRARFNRPPFRRRISFRSCFFWFHGHCQLLLAENVGKYIELGSTLDDAVGECFDKIAKMLNLPYPGGPNVENMAKKMEIFYPTNFHPQWWER